MAKGSPKKSGSPDKGSKKESVGKDDKKNKKGADKKTLPKWSAEECIKAESELFARRRYEVPMDASYKRVAHHIALIVRQVHVFEVYNEAPEVQQLCNSNKGSKGSPKSKEGKKSPNEKGSPKGKKPIDEDQPPPPIFEKPVIEGVVAMRRKLILKDDEKLFVEVCATWKYNEDSMVTPFPPLVRAEHQCYRDYYYIRPSNFERKVLPTPYNQVLIEKVRHEYGSEWEGYPFYFDLTGTPSSLTFNRPYNHKYPESGLFWVVRCFIGKYEFTKPTPDREVRMNFWKFTIAPSLLTYTLRKSKPFNYIRHQTIDDVGDLLLSVNLNRDLYYHGEEISATINIENNSQRHVINSITIYYEQNYRFFNEFPHDNSIPLGEIWFKPGENGLPINPKSKNWSKTIQLKPMYDWSKYNLICDGKMERDEKVFLASSTIIMKNIPLTNEEIEALNSGNNISPKKKGSPEKNTKESPKKEATKKGSPKNESIKKGKSPPKEEPILAPDKTENVVPLEIPIKRVLTNRELCHTVFVSYDIVVRINLQTPTDKEAGHPAVRVPFILSRETRFINKWTNPPTWNHLPIKCNSIHTMKSQPHEFCKKLDNSPIEEINKSPNAKNESVKKSKSSPKSKK